MTHAIRIHRTGGPEVLTWEPVQVGDPGPGQVRVRHTAVGLNYIDVYHRTGLYPVAIPTGLGVEGAGVIEAVGTGVKDFKVGQRIAYGGGLLGSYAEARIFPADRAVALPRDIDDVTAAAMMLKGMTAEYLLLRTYPVGKGDTVLIHAAAGGLGLIMCQWAKHLGATVIGTVGTPAKARRARANGCDHPIVYTREDFAKKVRRITRGVGVPVVYDLVGKATFQGSIDCLRPRGLMVCVGNASGPAPPVDPHLLSTKGSLYLTRTSLFTYTATRPELLASARALFNVVRKGHVRIEINQTYALRDAARAHRDLEARRTTGSTVLIP